MEKEILTAKEAMELLKISRSTFDRLKNNGTIKTYKMGRRIYCKYSEIITSLLENVPTTEA